MKTALITGATGQDGAYLMQLLQADVPDSSVLAIGRTASARDFARMAADAVADGHGHVPEQPESSRSLSA